MYDGMHADWLGVVPVSCCCGRVIILHTPLCQYRSRRMINPSDKSE